jgi:hypothetical protein
LQYAHGFTSGHTVLCILLSHGLLKKPKPGSYQADLSKKGKAYARTLYRHPAALPAADPLADPRVRALVEAAEATNAQIESLVIVMATTDRRLCCDGQMCGCHGATVYQEAEYLAKEASSKVTAALAPFQEAKP